MHKFLIVTATLLAATSAYAGQTRGLLTPVSNTQTAQLQAPEPKLSVADQLIARGEVARPAAATPVATPAAAAPVSTPAPQAAPAAATAAPQPAVPRTEKAGAEAAPARKVKKAKAQRRETDEQKARRIAGRYGISW